MDIEVAYGPRVYMLPQQKYIVDLISRIELSDNATVDTRMQLHHKLTPKMSEPLANPLDIVNYLVLLSISQSRSLTLPMWCIFSVSLFKHPH